MRDIQTVFDAVIAAGFYPRQASGRGNNAMCMALSSAVLSGVIEYEEYAIVKTEILKYVSGYGFLVHALQ